ncbi:Crp/Fnr family transcriptional regulator [Brevundimonas sp.]|uniref:Crp/Fnr family transcriptional regulator n=1 Tax=Brevundimonas sp. TaxID=1871086 RepID=UPI002D4D9F59|nr:Crp/Fnr family transcriptional regulator [Brevundimonas sp.]HYC68822.1 Crp/Fnr family transcriptional regulator [Brevundimonas sp.]
MAYGADLTAEDRALLADMSSNPREVPARTNLVSEGDKPRNVHLVMSGYACRYKVLPDGRRQIMAIFVPGDVCDLHVQILGEMDHSIGTLSDASVVEISPAQIDELIANPRINRGLWWMTLVDEGTLREWLVSMGQRGAVEQMAHIFCELHLRLRSVGLAENDSFNLPGTQEDLADLMGVTAVHVNRTLATLREKDLIRIDRGRLTIPSVDRLRAFGGFDPNYLHLRDGRGRGDQMREAPVTRSPDP